MLGTSTAGGIIGLFLNKVIITNRKAAVLIGGVIGIVSLVKNGLENSFFLSRLVTWVLPPICNMSESFCKNDSIYIPDFIWPFLWMLLYIAIETVAYILVMKRKKFE